jgi:hypothetical protein
VLEEKYPESIQDTRNTLRYAYNKFTMYYYKAQTGNRQAFFALKTDLLITNLLLTSPQAVSITP